MRFDHKILLCCVAAWLCCAAVDCRAEFLNRNKFKEENSLENDWFGKDDEVKILEESFRREPYHEIFRDPGNNVKSKECIDECGEKEDVKCDESGGNIVCGCSEEEKKFDPKEKECRACDCGDNGKCSFDDEGTKKCTCNPKFEEKGGICEACDCGDNGKCSFDGEGTKKCSCNENFVEKNGKCEDEACVDKCGASKNVECKENDDDFDCVCVDQQKKFDANKQECRGTCTAETSCNYDAKCEGDIEKFCNCPSGTSGDICDIIDDCATGIYKNCTGGDKGTCSYDTARHLAVCNCITGRKLKDKSGYCEVCGCGQYSDDCHFEQDAKVCKCKPDYKDRNGACAECKCGEFSEDCNFVKGDKECKCKEGYQDKNGICEECNCGTETKTCKFENGIKKCTCNEKFALKNAICEECECGTNAEGCSFQGEEKICKCKKGFKDNGGTCEECDCGVNSTSCAFVKGVKTCKCKSGNAQNDGKCEECKCGKNTKPCKFEDGQKICECIDKFALKDEGCTDCACGVNASGCEFHDKEKECFCDKGYAEKSGKCEVNKCFSKCGVESDDHPDIKCEGDKFGDISAIKCICHDEELKFDSKLKKCRATCSDEKKCDNGAPCRSRGDKFCDCFKGTTGDFCDVVTECDEKGQYAKCTDERGNCTYNVAKKQAECVCPPKKLLDKVEGYCQDECKTKEECSEDKICFQNSYCACEPGKRGDHCEIIPGCTEELQKKCADGGAVCAFSRTADNYASCDCQNEYLVFNEAQKKCIAKFCNDVDCKKPAVCLFDDENKAAYCKCPSGKYYNYNTGTCAEPDKCLLKKTACGENEVCEGGACKCKHDKDGEKCIKKFCKDDTCFKNADCDEDSGTCKCKEGNYYTGAECKELKCIENPFDESCPCPATMKRSATTKKCEPTATSKKLCDENKCGLGYCVDDNCICLPSISTKYKDKCVLNKDYVCASKELTDDLSKCRCTGKYKQAKDGITCELVTCSDDAVKEECKAMGATCKMTWKGNDAKYECVCPTGYLLNKEKGICADVCNSYDNVAICSQKNQMCYTSYSVKNEKTFTCGCAPPFTSQTCNELAEYVYLISDIPVMKDRYKMQNGIDYVKLNGDLMQSLSQMYTKDIFDAGYLHNYEEDGDILKTSMWVRFKANCSNELRRFSQQAQNFPNGTCDDCDTDLVVWPPNVVLSSQEVKNVKVENLSMCARALRVKLCGEEAGCDDNKCFCPRGYRMLEYTIKAIGDKARILRCEKTNVADLDECALGTHKCSDNTTCVKIPGSYICKCKPGYWKSTENDQKGCVDLCTPSPCGKGTCLMKKDKFNCKCQAGYGGSFCDERDVNFAAAKKSTVVVGAVLGTILIVAVLGVLFFYIKKRKNSYSEDFMPAPRQDNAAEMRERRPIRGIVNSSYE